MREFLTITKIWTYSMMVLKNAGYEKYLDHQLSGSKINHPSLDNTIESTVSYLS